MDQDEWQELIGHLRSELVSQHRDPDLWIEAEREESEIWLRNDASDDGEWIVFDMESEFRGQDLRRLAVDMVKKALGSS